MNTTVRVQNRNHLTIALAAGAVFALGLGLRQAQPLFISSLNSHTGIGYATISLAFGVAQLMWGVAQPVAGVVADRWGPRWVMIAGAALLAAANVATPFAGNAVVLTLLIGVLAAVGAGAIGPAMLISAANQRIPEAKRSVMTGIINAGGSFGQFTIIPLAQLLIGIAGWQPAMVILGVAGLAAVPLVMVFTPSTSAPAVSAASSGGTLGVALHRAIRDPSFLLLNAGFFTCGFHVAFIATHLPGVVALCGMPASVSAWSLVHHRPVQHPGEPVDRQGHPDGLHEIRACRDLLRAGDADPRVLLRRKDAAGLLPVRRRNRLHVPLDRPADCRPGREAAGRALPRDALRHGDALASDRRIPRRLARRQSFRGDPEL